MAILFVTLIWVSTDGHSANSFSVPCIVKLVSSSFRTIIVNLIGVSL